MKKKYIVPAEKHIDLGMEESLLIVVSDGTPATVGEDGVLDMDTKEEKTFGKNLWDDLW